LSEEVFGVHAASTATLFQPLLPILIVKRTLLGIRQDLIGVGQILEFLGGIWVMCILICKE
jgi:hypothetical protein